MMSQWIDRAKIAPSEAPRDWKEAVGRGFRCRCPACGEGRLFGKFLKVKPGMRPLRHGILRPPRG